MLVDVCRSAKGFASSRNRNLTIGPRDRQPKSSIAIDHLVRKFEEGTAGKVPILRSRGMISKGEAGNAGSDGMSDEISRHLREVGSKIYPDIAAVKWLYEGGELLQ